MTCIDGYAMAQKGRAGAALCIAAVGSWIAGTFGVLMLTHGGAAARGLRAADSGRPEYTALLVLGLVFLAYMSSTSLPRTLADGRRRPSARHHRHRQYDRPLPVSRSISPELGDGIGIVPVAVGLFGLGEILATPSGRRDRTR